MRDEPARQYETGAADATAEERRRLEVFLEHRRYLFAVAYRLLGVAEDAEDVLQDAWLRFASVRLDEVENARSYLVTVVTRLALDVLRAARRRREEYVGTWLPEPVPTDEALPEELAEQADSASFAFLLLLERLNPVERAVLVLHDVFDYSHEEIGRMTGRSTAASRQTLRRARLKLGAPRQARPAPVDEGAVAEFVSAARAGDVARLARLLAPDVVLMSDGGGKAQVINRPLAGDDRVARFLVAMASMGQHMRTVPADLNGQPAMVSYEGDEPNTVWVFDWTSAGVTAIYVMRNPDKMRRL